MFKRVLGSVVMALLFATADSRAESVRFSVTTPDEGWGRYAAIAEQFNRTLAGRFPFGPLDTQDADIIAIREFISGNADSLLALRDVLANSSPERAGPCVAFLDELRVALPLLRALSAEQPVIRLAVHWNTAQGSSSGTDQIVSWALLSGRRQIAFPSGGASVSPVLDWSPGDLLLIELQWAGQSRFRPDPAARAPGLTVNGSVASYAFSGAWAALRLLASSGPRTRSADHDTFRCTVGFEVPLVTLSGKPPSAPLRAFIDLEASTIDPTTQALIPLPLSVSLPHSAPQP